MGTNIELIKKLRKDTILESHELKQLLTTLTKEDEEFLYSQAREVKKEVYGDEVYIRGLIVKKTVYTVESGQVTEMPTDTDYHLMKLWNALI